MRKLVDIQKAEQEFFDKVWYDRSQMLVSNILEGNSEMPPEEIADNAGLARSKIETKYGKKNLGPYSEFEWGMINGKLSALRWILGDEWDFLDT